MELGLVVRQRGLEIDKTERTKEGLYTLCLYVTNWTAQLPSVSVLTADWLSAAGFCPSRCLGCV